MSQVFKQIWRNVNEKESLVSEICNKKINRNRGLLNMNHWGKDHGEFEFPGFIFVQMTLVSRRRKNKNFTILRVADELGL